MIQAPFLSLLFSLSTIAGPDRADATPSTADVQRLVREGLGVELQVLGPSGGTPTADRPLVAGDTAEVRFRLSETPDRPVAGVPAKATLRFTDASGAARSGLGEVRVMTYVSPGDLRTELRAREVGGGTYEAVLEPARPGAWFVHVAVPSRGVKYGDLPFHTVAVRPVPAAGADR